MLINVCVCVVYGEVWLVVEEVLGRRQYRESKLKVVIFWKEELVMG